MRHALFFPLKAPKASAKFVVLFSNEAKFLLHWVVLDLSVEGSLAQMLSDLDWSANSYGFDAEFKQSFEQVINSYV